MRNGGTDIYGTAVNYVSRLVDNAVGDQIVLSHDMFGLLREEYSGQPIFDRIQLLGRESFKGFESDQDIYTIDSRYQSLRQLYGEFTSNVSC